MRALRRAAHRGLRALTDGYRRLVSGPGPFACAVCGRRVRAFDPLPEFYLRQLREAGWPYGIDQFETLHVGHYSCPYCAAADRDRLLAIYLGVWFRALSGPATVIDFAPAVPLSAFIRREIAVRGLTIEYRTADLLAAGVDDRIDITDMPHYATGSVDLWLCSHVLEHVGDDRRAMRELLRVLKPGGRGALLVPIVIGLETIDEDPGLNDATERWRRFAQDDHVRLYSKSGFVGRLNESGFVVHEYGAEHFGIGRFAEQALGPASVLYVVEKPRSRGARQEAG